MQKNRPRKRCRYFATVVIKGVVIKNMYCTCEHCHGSFEEEKGLQRHVQQKQDACVLIQELKAAHKEELDQVQHEKAVHKEELIKVRQNLAIAATTVLAK